MPNHVTNQITFGTDSKALKAFFKGKDGSRKETQIAGRSLKGGADEFL